MEQNGFKSKGKISKVDVTEDILTGRGGSFGGISLKPYGDFAKMIERLREGMAALRTYP